MMNVRFATLVRGLAAGGGCLLLFGCGVVTPLSGDTVFGATPRPANAPVPEDPPGSLDGVYAGTATAANGGFYCEPTLGITNFQVVDGALRFGGFRGPINPDGSVINVPYNGAWLSGSFQGTAFHGSIDTEEAINQVGGCVYTLSLQRLGT